jgi:short-subunit dehydrogenase
MARAYAAPGVSLWLIGDSADELAGAAQDCRLRGALVNAACIESTDTQALLAHLEEVDRRAPVDILIVTPKTAQDRDEGRMGPPAWLRRQAVEVDLVGAITVVAALAERMQHRRRGRIALLDPFVALRMSADTPAQSASRAGLLAYGRSLRRRLKADNISVSVLRASAIATRIWERGRNLHPFELNPDRVAALLVSGVEHGRKSIVFPAPQTLGSQALAVLSAVVGEWLRATFLTTVDPVGEPDHEAVLSRESSRGE